MQERTFLEIVLKLLAVAVLVLLNGFFVSAEFALVKVRRSQLDELIQKGRRWAKFTRQVVEHLDEALSACQLGVTLASLGLGWIGEPVFSALLSPMWHLLGFTGPAHETLRHSVAVVVGFSLITFLHISAGEQAPKWLAIQRPLSVALVVGGPLLVFQRVMYPFIQLLNRTSLWLLHLVGLSAGGEYEVPHSEEELKLILASAFARKRDKSSNLIRDVMLNTFELPERFAREVMQPRKEIVGFAHHWPIEQCLEVARQTRYSRFPLLEAGDLDRVLGVVHVKDLYTARDSVKKAADLIRYARPVHYVPEWARLHQVLMDMIDRQVHICIVVDEYGATVGLVTMEDILEELVGEIRDEFDTDEVQLIKPIGKEKWRLDGRYPIHELEELLGVELEVEEVATVAGLVTYRLGRLPEKGESIRLDGWELVVEEMDQTTIRTLRLQRAER